MTSQHPIIELNNVWRSFQTGEEELDVLKGINLTLYKGEIVAIVGSSGSGKSTLMNILGCLDRPSSGTYKVLGKETSLLGSEGLSHLRRNHFGFIFQKYHLLGALHALGNVEIPAIYADMPAQQRHERASLLLTRLGLKERLFYRPSQLSGGQQQRVSIARALMNGGEIVLADEPTGALDKASGEEVLKILDELHQEGKTIIIVTHDPAVAQRAQRIIEISDGVILSDSYNKKKGEQSAPPLLLQEESAETTGNLAPALTPQKKSSAKFFEAFNFNRFFEAFRMALLSLNATRMRSFLTMLGVIIGISTVIAMVALGNGIKKGITDNLNSFGTNTLTIFPGHSMADRRAFKVTTLTESDVKALKLQSYVQAVTPSLSGSAVLRTKEVEASGSVSGVGEQFFATKNRKLLEGRLFDAQTIEQRRLEVVLGKNSINLLFPHYKGSVIGKIVWIGDIPAPVAGIVEDPVFGSGDTIELYIPYTAMQTRFLGNQRIRMITLRVAGNIDSRLAEEAVTRFLIQRHGTKDFFIRNSEEFRKKVNSNVQMLTVFVASIAFISLIVGGIGVMNIMLVTVSERINEIGVRMAVGARQSDVLQQFLIESILVCVLGGIIGVLLALALGSIFTILHAPFTLIYSWQSIVLGFIFSSCSGVVFGFFPARKASKLDPVSALSRD